MSANSDAGSSARRAAASAVREAFGALPFSDRISTLVKVELDMLGDLADGLVSAVERVGDEIAGAFNCEPEATPPGADHQAHAN